MKVIKIINKILNKFGYEIMTILISRNGHYANYKIRISKIYTLKLFNYDDARGIYLKFSDDIECQVYRILDKVGWMK